MLNFKLNGKDVTTSTGTTILNAAKENGISIPHFCYHRDLTIDGCCRMCLVEVERIPKLVIACNTQVTSGMVISTESPKVKKVQRSVIEFFLINHPLDCPICDEAGECKLQKYAYEYGNPHGRFHEEKRKGRKRIVLGPNIIFDEERCILCRRCVRFCREVTKTRELGVTNRGDFSQLELYPGKSLDNEYSLNVVDICPVGALTNKHFRFKTRVWFLKETKSVCSGCSNNCSIRYSHRNSEVFRILPINNPEVNKSWLCDYGRFTYQEIASENRLKHPLLKKNDIQEQVTWDIAMRVVVKRIRNTPETQIMGLLSAQMTNEEIYLFIQLLNQKLLSPHLDVLIPTWEADDILKKKEKVVNSEGLRLISQKKVQVTNIKDFLKKIITEKIQTLYITGNELLKCADDPNEVLSVLNQIPFLIVQSHLDSEIVKLANVVLPSTHLAEKSGTVTNIDGYLQKINPAVTAPGQAKDDLDILLDLAKSLEVPFEEKSVSEVFLSLKSKISSFSNIDLATFNDKATIGVKLNIYN